MVPQPALAKEPQVPENTCTLGVCAVKFAPILLSVMVGLVVCAVKLYQTSYSTVPAHAAAVPAVNVALATVPVVVVQVSPDVKAIALAQRSFAGAGGSCMQILNVPSVAGTGDAVIEKTRIK